MRKPGGVKTISLINFPSALTYDWIHIGFIVILALENFHRCTPHLILLNLLYSLVVLLVQPSHPPSDCQLQQDTINTCLKLIFVWTSLWLEAKHILISQTRWMGSSLGWARGLKVLKDLNVYGSNSNHCKEEKC